MWGRGVDLSPVGSVVPSLGLAACGRGRYIGGGGMQIATRSGELTGCVRNIACGDLLVSVAHAASRFAVPVGKATGSNTQFHEDGPVLSMNVPLTSAQAAAPAVPNGALPWAPSLTQSPWLANMPPATET